MAVLQLRSQAINAASACSALHPVAFNDIDTAHMQFFVGGDHIDHQVAEHFARFNHQPGGKHIEHQFLRFFFLFAKNQ